MTAYILMDVLGSILEFVIPILGSLLLLFLIALIICVIFIPAVPVWIIGKLYHAIEYLLKKPSEENKTKKSSILLKVLRTFLGICLLLIFFILVFIITGLVIYLLIKLSNCL